MRLIVLLSLALVSVHCGGPHATVVSTPTGVSLLSGTLSGKDLFYTTGTPRLVAFDVNTGKELRSYATLGQVRDVGSTRRTLYFKDEGELDSISLESLERGGKIAITSGFTTNDVAVFYAHNRSIFRLDDGTSLPRLVAAEQDTNGQVAVTQSTVYWPINGANGDTIVRSTRDEYVDPDYKADAKGFVVRLLTVSESLLAVTASQAGDVTGANELVIADATGQFSSLGSNVDLSRPVFYDGQHLYWCERAANAGAARGLGARRTLIKATSQTFDIAPQTSSVCPIATDENYVYFAGANEITRVLRQDLASAQQKR